MFPMQEHVSKATQAGMASQFDAGAALTDTMMDGMQQVADLHLNLARATLEQSNFAARQLMSAKDSRHFLTLAAAQIQPSARRAFDYGYYLTTIAADTQTSAIHVIGYRVAEANRVLIELAGDAGSALCGWKAVFSILRDLMENASTHYGELTHPAQSLLRSVSPQRAIGDVALGCAVAGRRRVRK